MRIDIAGDIETAKQGRKLWLQIRDKYNYKAQSDCVILIAAHNEEMIRIAMEELPAYMRRKYLRKALVIQNSIGTVQTGQRENVQTLEVTQAEMDSLLKYYRLAQFTGNIVVISAEEPFGNDNIIGHEGITFRNYVADALYA